MRFPVFPASILIFLFLTMPVSAQWFPEGGRIFPKISADPEEVQTAGQYFRLKGQDTTDFSVGNNWGIRRWDAGEKNDWPLQLDVSGVIIPRFILSNPAAMEALDLIINVPFEVRHGIYSARFTGFHKSSHLGDTFIEQTGMQRIPYSREGFQSMFAVEPWRLTRFYAGETQLVHTDPNVGTVTLQTGFELRSPLWRGAGTTEFFAYLGEDVQSKQEVKWNVNSNTQIGLAVGFAGNPRKFRVFGSYFTGHSIFGQFYTQQESYMGLGMGIDF
jgi:hypothetical protein